MRQLETAKRLTQADLIAAAIIIAGLLGVTYLHYSTAPSLAGLHAVYRYFYFLPIVYAALRFGYWGGLLAALVASLLFAPHIVFKWGNFPEDSINDLLVVVVFFGVAIITGVTVDRLRAAQIAEARTAAELAASLRRLEEQGEELRRAERLSALGSLAGGLAHQIRNPVGIIRASAQLLEMTPNAEAQESALVIAQESDRIESLIQDLLRYTDGVHLQFEAVAPHTLLHQVAARIQPMAAAAAIELKVEAAESLPPIVVDVRQMEQALLNLTVNALQAVGQPPHAALPKKGHITLSAHCDPGELYSELAVSDNGPGMSKAEQQQIFDPFFSTKESGSGLGLSVVHRIIEDHGARLVVRSAPGAGATFAIQIPLGTASLEEAQSERV